ncbi:MAG: DMT family transporter [Candidatus Pristimantibacillus lignocellulolyticus]|uniref:DMT family transporter n=1 Tax=Candidatus Pristimantibacillus lignocellulolyticus TaxID=2994561 RepID=A0A9J6ZF06_9BACL|nr:MAG: DMT family transporter [Candidatus Pristimantibacillus lignocellulolyticus]
MWLFLSILSAIVFGTAGWWMKVSQMKRGSVNTLLLALYIVGALGFGVNSIIDGSYIQLLDLHIWIAGLIIGLGSALGNLYFMRALDTGPATLTSPLTNMNIVLVVLLGTLVYGELLVPIQIFSIILLIFATILITQKKESKSITSSWWYGFILLAIIMFTIRNGGLKVTEELGYESAPVLFVAYFMAIFFYLKPVVNDRSSSSNSKAIGWRYGAVTGLLSYGGLQLYAVALQYGQSNLVAPIFATNGLIVTIFSIIIYKERLSRIQWVAFASLLLGLICIRITL